MKYCHLILKHKWYDKIDSGQKKIEYRDNTPYWRKRLLGAERIVFHKGYTKTTMTFKPTIIDYTGNKIEIHLGEKTITFLY